MSLFRLESVQLHNFRCFEQLKLELEPDLTVLYAENGGGKTQLLTAMAALLESCLREPKRPLWSAENWEGLVRHVASPEGAWAPTRYAMVAAQAEIGGQRARWHRDLRIQAQGRSRSGGSLAELLRALAQLFQPTTTWPLLAWYGPQRRWTRGKDQLELPLLRPTRQEAYEGSLATGGSEDGLHLWFHMQTLADLQARQEGRPVSGWEAQVREAMRRATPGVTGLRYDLRRGELRIAFEGGREVGWSQLSDGYHAFLGLVGDIGRRAAILNDHLGEAAVRDVEGLVLIDEIDLHLHPRWQLSVLDGLRKAFPRLQLVVTSHSTLLLSSVENRQVRELQGLQVSSRPHHVAGRDANALLREELQAQVRHPRGQRWLDELAGRIDAGDRPGAMSLIADLRERWGPTDPELAYYEALLSLDEA